MEPQAITLDPAAAPLGGWALLPVPREGDRAEIGREVAANQAKTDGQECPSSGGDANSGRDVEWLREVIARWEGPLVRYAARVAGDLDLGRDVVQETFLRLCREERSKVEEHLARWLFAVCRSRALDVRRKESRMSAVLDLDERTSPGEVPPDELLERRETAGRLMSLLDRLPDNQQEVIRLKFQNDLSYREIADITGHSVSNVGFLLHTGIKRLREMMKDEG
ncbi:MAG: sigma-70 family RNA polymerase sigma factor [Candidatus Saccharimonas sp.]|nr:sigma-70 family RNA polymerase sigma factor [Planctomycetaceae bacterium]